MLPVGSGVKILKEYEHKLLDYKTQTLYCSGQHGNSTSQVSVGLDPYFCGLQVPSRRWNWRDGSPEQPSILPVD